MPNNLLEQLKQREVPAPPREMGREVHVRLNQWLAFAQSADLMMRAFAYAAGYFGEAVVGLISYSLTGKFPRRDGPGRDGNTPDT